MNGTLNEKEKERNGSETRQYQYLLHFWKNRKFIDCCIKYNETDKMNEWIKNPILFRFP
jgi:hypothetical protein